MYGLEYEVFKPEKIMDNINGAKVKRYGNLREVNAFIDGMKAHTNLKYFFVSVGCNEIDTKSGEIPWYQNNPK